MRRVTADEGVYLSIPYRTDSGESDQKDEFEGQSPNHDRLILNFRIKQPKKGLKSPNSSSNHRFFVLQAHFAPYFLILGAIRHKGFESH